MAQIIETKKSGTQQDIGKSILQSLEQIKSSYDSKIPKVDYSQVDNLPTRQVVMPTSAEIKSEATKDLENYKSASLNKINTDYYTNLQSQQTAKQNSKADLQNNIAIINNKAKQDIETLQSKSINQGIENSSIVDNQKATIAKQRIADLTSAKQQYLSKLDAINLKKDIYEQQKELALAKFDIAYANKLNKQINTLTSQYNTALKNAEEYQSLIDQKRSQIEEDFDAKYGTTVANLTQDMQREMTYDVFVKLKDLPKDQTQEILNNNPKIEQYLGDWYSALKLWLNR